MEKKRTLWIILVTVAAAAILCSVAVGAIISLSKAKTDGRHAFSVYINEIMVSNDSVPNREGVCCDYIELHNGSDRAVSLAGYQLEDDRSGERYVLPQDALIEPDGYLTVYCSREHEGPYYAGFGLSKLGGEKVFFLNPQSVVVETVTTLAAGKDVAQGLDDEQNWSLLPFATPDFPNTHEGYRQWSERHTIVGASDVRINEIMISNTVYKVADGAPTDWIELYNSAKTAVSLDGFGLSDDLDEPVWFFPAGTMIEGGSYLLVPCAPDLENGARFGLSKAGGEDVTLFFADGTVADTLLTVRTARNQSFARTEDGSWSVTFAATPGFANTAEGRDAYVRSLGFSDIPVHITELMADNKSTLADADGKFYDWVELTNTGERAVSLSGWFLSDDETDPMQWQIPDCTIEAGQRLLILFAGNLDGEIDGTLYAPMSLSAAGETVYLVDPIGQMTEQVTFAAMEEDRSLVIEPDSGTQRVCDYPTPGFADTDEGYAQFCETRTPNGALAIWEVMTANDAYLPQSGEFYDWVELKNVSSEPIRLNAYSLSDASGRPDRCPLPDVVLAPGELYPIILSGHAEYTTQRAFHADFALNAQEDRLFLFENGRLIDYAHLYALPYRTSYGRSADHGGFFYMPPTPGAENESGWRMISEVPTASVQSGVYQSADGIDVTLDANGTIYYTTDCSDPTERSAVYTGPVHLDRSGVIRAVAYEPGKKESRVVTYSYLLNEPHDLPVVSLVTDPWHLWDADRGIYVDSVHRKEIEYPASVAYFGDDGTWAQECGIKMHGVSSLKDIDKHSFTVKFSGVYGGPLHYDIFGDGAVTTFKSVILRADYESTWASFIRDNMLHSIAKEYSPTMLSQNYKYVVLYLNGSYWGIYAIREQYTPFYVASNLGVPEDAVTVCKNYMTADADLAAVYRYVTQHDMRDPSQYAYAQAHLDLSSFIDWAIFEAYCGNSDISGNVRYLYSAVDGKWRCGLVDVDLGFFHQPAFSFVLDAPQVGALLQRLLKNESFKAQLLTRMSELLSGGLSDAAVTAKIDGMAAEIRSEIPYEKQRWPKVGNWENLIVSLKNYVDGRSRRVINNSRSELGLSEAELRTYFASLL